MRFKGLRKRRISLYTGLQLGLFVLCWVINLSPAGLAVAFLIVALVPLRERLLPRIFSEAREWANTPSPFPPLPCAILTLHPTSLGATWQAELHRLDGGLYADDVCKPVEHDDDMEVTPTAGAAGH